MNAQTQPAGKELLCVFAFCRSWELLRMGSSYILSFENTHDTYIQLLTILCKLLECACNILATPQMPIHWNTIEHPKHLKRPENLERLCANAWKHQGRTAWLSITKHSQPVLQKAGQGFFAQEHLN